MPTKFEFFDLDTGSAGVKGLDVRAQTFTPLIPHRLTSIFLKLFRLGLPIGIVNVSIEGTDINAHPVAPTLASGSIDGDSITPTEPGEWYEFVLAGGVDLSRGVKYAIVVSAPDAESYLACGRNIAGTYSGGCAEWSLGGIEGIWTSYPLQDLVFEEWGNAASLRRRPRCRMLQ